MDKKITLSGIRLQEQKASFGLQIIQDLLLLFKKQEQGYIISLINHGGVKYQNNIGDKPKSKGSNLRSLLIDFGIRKLVTKEIKLFSYLKTLTGNKLNKN